MAEDSFYQSDTQRWQTELLEELRAIRRLLEEGNAKLVEYFPDGRIKRVSMGLCSVGTARIDPNLIYPGKDDANVFPEE